MTLVDSVTPLRRRLGALALIAWGLLSPTGLVWADPVADAVVAGYTSTVTTTPPRPGAQRRNLPHLFACLAETPSRLEVG